MVRLQYVIMEVINVFFLNVNVSFLFQGLQLKKI